MRTVVHEKAAAPALAAASWIRNNLAPPADDRRRSRRALITAASLIFLAALGVRLLYWQDIGAEVAQKDSLLTVLLKEYRLEAERMISDGGILFPNDPNPQEARMILHPPGYSILLVALYGERVSGGTYTELHLLQAAADACAAVLVFLIADELVAFSAAIVAALLVAFSPHLAYYSLWLSPDSLSVPPVLIAVYLIIRAVKRPRLITVIAAGVCVGLSCWLRTNALLLAPFIALLFPLLFERGKRLRYSIAFVAATVVVIAPITVRNYVVFRRFIPLSLASGLNLVQGIGEFDHEKRFDMPVVDRDALKKDVEWHNRPDYGGNLWSPDGIERDEYRFRRGLEVIRSHPFWFAGVMIRRAAFMLTYDKPLSKEWTAYTVIVPLVSAEPSFGHDVTLEGDSHASRVYAASDFITEGTALSPGAEVALAADQQAVMIAGDGSEFADQFALGPIPVEKNTDYLLALSVESLDGPAAVKVTDANRRIALASKALSLPTRDAGRKRRARKAGQSQPIDSSLEQEPAEIKIPFASGNRTEVLLVVSNDGASSTRPELKLRQTTLYNLGPTPTTWTRAVRPLVRGVEKNIYTTRLLVPLIFLGIALLFVARRGRAIVILLAAPAYYIGLHSAFCTEYRYILAIHYFLFILAGVTLFCAGKLAKDGAHKVFVASGLIRHYESSRY